MALCRRHGGAMGPQLLVLRVFSEDPTRQILLDELQDHWRYAGPVQQIAVTTRFILRATSLPDCYALSPNSPLRARSRLGAD
jgi:hypothetical protein